MKAKTAILIEHMRAERWDRALALAATFRMLGRHRQTIIRAHQASWHPRFFQAVNRDPDLHGRRAVLVDGVQVGRACVRSRRYGGGTYCGFVPRKSKDEWIFETIADLRRRLPAMIRAEVTDGN